MSTKGSKYAVKRRSRLISLRLSEEEYRTLSLGFVGSGARSMSDHLRMLLGTRVGSADAQQPEPEWLKTLNRKLATLTEKVEQLINREQTKMGDRDARAGGA